MRFFQIATFTALFVFAITLIGLFALREGPQPPAPGASPFDRSFASGTQPDTASTAELQQLQHEVALLKQVLESVRASQEALGDELDGLGGPVAAAIDSEEEDLDPTTLEEREREWARTETERLEARLTEDAPDPEWTDFATRELEQGLAENDFEAAQVLASECGAELCRIEVGFDDNHDMMDAIGLLPDMLPTEGGTWWFADEETNRVTLYSDRHDRGEG